MQDYGSSPEHKDQPKQKKRRIQNLEIDNSKSQEPNCKKEEQEDRPTGSIVCSSFF